MGLYQVLGMDKTNLTKMMVWESIYTAGAGILGGILAGIVFGRLIFLVLLKFDPVLMLHFSFLWNRRLF